MLNNRAGQHERWIDTVMLAATARFDAGDHARCWISVSAPLRVRKEVPGFIADRLLEAVWREALHLVNDGVATTGEIDDAIRFGAGIRWSFMGTFLTYTLAGGDAGMRHFMAQFGPALELPWTKLVAPKRATASGTEMSHAAPLQLHRDIVRSDWVDYNGHLRDAFYLLIFSYATDALMDYIGLDQAERTRTHGSIYTLECHINYLHEVKVGAEVRVETQLIGHDAKRLHIYHAMHLAGAAEPVSVSEQMLLHVDMRGPRSAAFDPDVMARVQAIAAAHSRLPQPKYAGRVIRLPAPFPAVDAAPGTPVRRHSA